MSAYIVKDILPSPAAPDRVVLAGRKIEETDLPGTAQQSCATCVPQQMLQIHIFRYN